MGAILRLAKDFRRAGSSRILPRWRTRRGRSREGARPLRGSFFEPSVFPVPPLQELGLRLRRARGVGRAAERVQEARFLFVSGDFLESLEELFWIRVGEVSDRVDSQVPEIGGNSGADPGQRGQLVVHGQGPPTAYPRFQITLPEISRGKHEEAAGARAPATRRKRPLLLDACVRADRRAGLPGGLAVTGRSEGAVSLRVAAGFRLRLGRRFPGGRLDRLRIPARFALGSTRLRGGFPRRLVRNAVRRVRASLTGDLAARRDGSAQIGGRP